jgi:acetyl-CoA acetyltransferase
MIAEKYNISRDDLDKISGQSHEKAAEAIKKGPCFIFYILF